MYELIITEKPSAAKKIADALADGKAIKESKNGVPYYKITHGNTDIVVVCAVGHLYGLRQKEGKKGIFPVFEIEWKPTSEMSKKADFSKKYLDVIKKLAKEAKTYVVACDYDVEGEVIGLNIIRFACRQKDAARMKFSTLTKDDLRKAYADRSKTLDWGQAKAGEARHFLDWFFGVNISRALTHAIKTTGAYKLMSTGRVQGPTLKLIVDKEKEIAAFKAVPFWEIELHGTVNDGDIIALHEQEKFFKKEEADAVMKRVHGQKTAVVQSAEKKQFQQQPPNPFDLTSLQIEAHKTLNISPKNTLAIAQDLYTSGYISYPRTSSNQLPKEIGFSKIIGMLAKQALLRKEAESLLKKASLQPNNGKKADPAHPALYPTGSVPKLKDKDTKDLYELIARRFLATFGEPAVRETLKAVITCNDERFIAKGTTTVNPGWHTLYGRFVMLKEDELPVMKEGDKVAVKDITLLDKETQPPRRYTESSIIKELEKRNLGTKATRAAILDTLFLRGYVDGKSIQATELGMRTCSALEKHCPSIIDEQLTREFEEEMEEIREKKKTEEEIISHGKTAVTKIIKDFKSHEKEIGKELQEANIETRDTMSRVGACPGCKEGELHLRRGKFGMFIACNKYPDCATTFSLPGNALIRPSPAVCETCNHPKVLVIKKKKRPQEICINPDCASKVGKAEQLAAGQEKDCPKCGKAMKLRKSLYGSFWGCSAYPKCRHIERI